MYEITNQARRVTSISLPGRDILLQPRGKKGSKGMVTDREFGEDGIKGPRAARVITCVQTQVDKLKKAPIVTAKSRILSAPNAEARRIAATEAATARAKDRNKRAAMLVKNEKLGRHKIDRSPKPVQAQPEPAPQPEPTPAPETKPSGKSSKASNKNRKED